MGMNNVILPYDFREFNNMQWVIGAAGRVSANLQSCICEFPCKRSLLIVERLHFRLMPFLDKTGQLINEKPFRSTYAQGCYDTEDFQNRIR